MNENSEDTSSTSYTAGYEHGQTAVREDVEHGVARVTLDSLPRTDWDDALLSAGADAATEALGVEKLYDEHGDLTAEAQAACELYNAGANAGATAELSA